MSVGIQSNQLGTSEFALAIALTVFIIITVILAVLLIALAASKNFRTVFFREKTKKKKSAKKSSDTPVQSEPQAVDTVPLDQPAPKPRRAPARRSSAEPEYLNAIPTVPLGGFTPPPSTPTPKPRASRRQAADDAIEAQESSTYTTRSITITRARPSSKPIAQENKTEKSGTDRTGKKR